MKLRTRLLVFLAVLHLAVAVLVFLLYPDNAVLFIAAEVVLLGSFLTGWRWVNRAVSGNRRPTHTTTRMPRPAAR